MKENYDNNNENFSEQDEERKYFFSSKKSDKKPLCISGCNSHVYSTRNLNSLNKHFSSNNEILDEAILMNNKKQLNFYYPNQGN